MNGQNNVSSCLSYRGKRLDQCSVDLILTLSCQTLAHWTCLRSYSKGQYGLLKTLENASLAIIQGTLPCLEKT